MYNEIAIEGLNYTCCPFSAFKITQLVNFAIKTYNIYLFARSLNKHSRIFLSRPPAKHLIRLTLNRATKKKLSWISLLFFRHEKRNA